MPQAQNDMTIFTLILLALGLFACMAEAGDSAPSGGAGGGADAGAGGAGGGAGTSNEDGGGVGSPPGAGSPAGGEAAAAGSGSSSAPSPDPDDLAFDRLAEQASARTAAPASPSNPASRPPGSVPPSADPAAAGYPDLDPRGLQALQRVHRLPDPATWAALPPAVKQNLVGGAVQELSAKERAFQAAQAQKNGQPDPGPQPAAAQPAQAQPAQPAAAANPRPSLIDEKLAARLEQIGGEDMPKALGEALGGFGQRVATAMQQMAQSMEQRFTAQMTQLQQQNAFLLDRLAQGEEGEAMTAVQAELPEGDEDFAKDETKAEIRANAKAFLMAQWGAGNRKYTWKQAVLDAARARCFPQLQQNAQRKLADRRRASIQGTPARPSSSSRSAPALTEPEIDDRAFDELAKGKTAAEVLDHLR